MQHRRTSSVRTHVLVTDRDLNIRWVNDGFCHRLSCEAEDFINKPLAEALADGEGAESVALLREKMSRSEYIEGLPVTFVNPRQKKIALEFDVIPVLDIDNHLALYMAIGGKRAAKRRSVRLPKPDFESTYQTSSLSFEEGLSYYKDMQRLMTEEEVYLDPGVSVAMISRKLGTNTQYLSQVVNFFGGERFSSYINVYRLEHLGRLIAERPELNPQTAWEEVGFGSYSAFYRSLRRHYQLSPSQFFEQHSRDADA